MRLKLFLNAVWNDWLAMMSGIASLILAILGASFTLDQYGVRVSLIVAAFGCLLVSSFSVWNGVYSQLLKLESDGRPKIIGFIKVANISEWSRKHRESDGTIRSEPGFLRITATLNLVNVGTVPTTIKNISCTVHAPPPGAGCGGPSRPVGGYDDLFVNQIFDYMEKARPLTQGRHIEGEVEFDIPMKRSEFDHTQIHGGVTFSVRDAWEQEHPINEWATPSFNARPKKEHLKQIEEKRRRA